MLSHSIVTLKKRPCPSDRTILLKKSGLILDLNARANVRERIIPREKYNHTLYSPFECKCTDCSLKCGIMGIYN